MKVAVVGSINMDMVLSSERIPLKGETVKSTGIEYKCGGKGANQAVAMARLGMEVYMFGKVGDDDMGRTMLENLKKNNVNVDNVLVQKGVSSGLAVITVAENDNTIVIVSGANGEVDTSYIDSVKDNLFKCDFVVMQHEIHKDTNAYVMKICKENNIKTLLNPAPARQLSDDERELPDYITPNEHEVKLIFKEQNLDKVLEQYKGKLVVTLGSDGAATFVEGKGVVKVPCRKSNVVDTTGAGDTFNGAFVYAMCNRYDYDKALKFANVASGLSVEKFGAQGGMPTLQEVEANL